MAAGIVIGEGVQELYRQPCFDTIGHGWEISWIGIWLDVFPGVAKNRVHRPRYLLPAPSDPVLQEEVPVEYRVQLVGES